MNRCNMLKNKSFVVHNHYFLIDYLYNQILKHMQKINKL